MTVSSEAMSETERLIRIIDLEKRDLKGATVIDGFPSVGLVSTIAANYIINTLQLEQIALVESSQFPSVSVIREGEPLNPVRIYAGEQACQDDECNQIVVLISEFSPKPQLINALAKEVLDWMQEKRCDLLISPEGLSLQTVDNKLSMEEDPEEIADINPPTTLNGEMKLPDVDSDAFRTFGVASTPRARQYIEKYNIVPFNNGTVAGVSGVFLTEGSKRNFDVLALLAEAHQEFPDAKAAARVIEIINKVLLQIPLDPAPLYKQAETLEAQIKAMRSMAQHQKQTGKKLAAHPSMFG